MPRDLFEENGIDVLSASGGVDLLAEDQLVDQSKQEGGFLARTGENLGKAWREATTPIVSRGEFLDSVPGFPIIEKAAAVAAPIGKTVVDAALTGAKGLYHLTTSPETRENISDALDYLGDTDFVKAQLRTLRGAHDTARAVAPRGTEFTENVLDASNIIPAVGIGKAMLPALPRFSTKTLDDVVGYGFKKGIKPSVEGKSDAGLTAKFYDNAKTAVREQVEKYPDSIPENVEQFSQNIRKAKKDIWAESTAMAEAAGEKGATTSISPLRREMETIINSKNVTKSAKDSARKILDEIESYADEITPVEAEELIAHFNSRSKPFWNDPNPNKLDDALFNERAASIIRKTTDQAIESYEGPGWQDLRKRYGAQTAIEKAVANRANIAARRNAKGFFDLADVFSTGEFVAGLLTMNPTQIAKASTMHGVKKYINKVNNVDNIVKKMFKDTKKILDKERIGRASIKEAELPSYPVGPTELSEAEIDNLLGVPFSPELAAELKRARVPRLPYAPDFQLRPTPEEVAAIQAGWVGSKQLPWYPTTVGEPFTPDMLPAISEAVGEGFTSVPKSRTSGISPMDTTRAALTPDIGWGPAKLAVSDLNYKTRQPTKTMTMKEALRIFREAQKKSK